MLLSPSHFEQRAHLSEWMDEPSSYEQFHACLRDLEEVNHLLRGYRPTERWLQQYRQVHPGSMHLLDAGFGGGGFLHSLEASGQEHISLTGIDLNPHAARSARATGPKDSKITWLTGDIYSYEAGRAVDVVVSSLFTHHLTEEEIIRFLKWMEKTACGGWFINDLRRSVVSYYTFALLASLMRWHPFVQHDGPVSVRRGFRREDWERMCRAAGLDMSTIHIEDAPMGRLCVSRLKG